MTPPNGPDSERDGSSLLRAALERRIAGVPGCVVSLRDGRPAYDERIRKGRATDPSAPEEAVRALFVIHLAHDLGYKPESVILEHPVRARAGRGQRDKYADIAVVRKENGAEPAYALIELKTEDRYGAERDDAWESQLFGLAAFVNPRPDVLIYGTAHAGSAAAVNLEAQTVDADQFRDYAAWKAAGYPLSSDAVSPNYGKPRKTPYVKGGEKDLRYEVTGGELDSLRVNLHNVLWGGGSSTDTDVFNLLTRLILAKVTDERKVVHGERYGFQVLDGEDLADALDRINSLYREGLVTRLNVSPGQASAKTARESGKGTDAQIRFAIESLERYALFALANSPSGADLLGDFFERIMRQGFKQDKGQFFTHANIADFVARALDIEELSVERALVGEAPPKVIDPSAGSGTFLVKAMERVFAGLLGLAESRPQGLSDRAREVVDKVINLPRRHAWAGDHCYGLEINSDLGLAAQINMLLHADGSSSIFTGPEQGDGLASFAQYGQSPELSTTAPHPLYGFEMCERFDALVSNPPFSVKYTQDEINRYKKSLETASHAKDSEVLFLDRWFQLLKPGGRLGAVVPNSMLDGVKSAGRDYLLERFWVRAVVSLPSDAFYPHTLTKTSLVFAQKKTVGELRDERAKSSEERLMAQPPILFARAAYLGYKRAAKREHRIERNDLTDILARMKRARIWDGGDGGGQPSDLLRHGSLRLDADYALSQTGVRAPAPASGVFIVAEIEPETGEPPFPYRYCEIGDIDRMGRISPRLIEPDQPNADADEEPDNARQTDRIRKKVQQGDIMAVDGWAVLVPLTRAYLGKFAVVTGDEDCYFTTALIPFVPGKRLAEHCGGDDGLAVCLLFLLLKGELQPLLSSLSRWGKTYPTLNRRDLENAVIDEGVLQRCLSPSMTASANALRNVVLDARRTDARLRDILQDAEAPQESA